MISWKLRGLSTMTPSYIIVRSIGRCAERVNERGQNIGMALAASAKWPCALSRGMRVHRQIDLIGTREDFASHFFQFHGPTMFRLLIAVLFIVCAPVFAAAQSTVWIQVEAQRSLQEAQERAADYASRLPNVAGFSVGRGWFGIVLGPYTRADADTLLNQLKRSRQIPQDSFLNFSNRLGQQFWPVGTGAPNTPQPLPQTDAGTAEPTEDVAVVEVPVIQPSDETPAEARASEAALSREDKRLLQTAMKWAGFYTSTIDGAFGRGTRRAMGEWQVANNFEPTGILTTKQRAVLLGAYNAVLEGMDLQLVRDDAAGIEVIIPTGAVAFREYEPPFARYDSTGDIPAQVLLISQAGDQDRLFGLYEILQTLAIVPTDGPRRRNERSFELEGIGDGIHSYTTATLANGAIKGFILVWPAGDDERRTDVLTTTDVVGDCNRLTIDTVHDAEIIHEDAALGLAVLRPAAPLAPMDVAAFQTGVPRLQSDVAVAGFPFGGVLTAPTLTFGKLADIRGLNGEDDVKRLAITAHDGDAGGPVFDNGGAVLGMLLPRTPLNGQQLPSDVSFSVDASEVMRSLETAGISTQATDDVALLPASMLAQRAAAVTVLVSCW